MLFHANDDLLKNLLTHLYADHKSILITSNNFESNIFVINKIQYLRKSATNDIIVWVLLGPEDWKQRRTNTVQ